MIVLIDTFPGGESFFGDSLEEGLAMLALSYRPVMRLFQHPKTGEVRVPATPKKFLNLVQHLIKTKQLPGTRIHTQKAMFKSKLVSGVKIRNFARKAEEYIILWPEGSLRVRFHANTHKGLFYFSYAGPA